MKKYFSTTLRFLFIVFTLALGVSCVRPEIDGCVDPRGNVRLNVNLDVDIATRAAGLPYQIENATVYIFDADNKYIASCRGEAYTGEPYEFYLNLESGDYHFVVWTNQGDRYRTSKSLSDDLKNRTTLSELEFIYDHSTHDCQSELIPDLLYGSTSRTIDANRDNHVDVLMRPDTYTIRIKVKGLPACADDFDFSISDNNSHYAFDNTIIEGKEHFQHTRTCRQAGGELNTSIRTLRLSHDRSPLFAFSNATTGERLFENCLIKTICGAYEAAGQSVDFNKMFTYDIVLSYDVNMNLTVSVNGWNYNPKDFIME